LGRNLERQAWESSVYHPPAEYQLPQDEWKLLRDECFERDDRRCVRCGSADILSAHHIMPRKEGGPDALYNLVTLCHPCHEEVEDKGFRTLGNIKCQYDAPIEEPPLKPILDRKETFVRPAWHAWVYGGQPFPEPGN